MSNRESRLLAVPTRGASVALASFATVLLALVFSVVSPGKAFAEVHYVDIWQDTVWQAQDWRGDPIQEPDHYDGIVITLHNNATVTVTGHQYFFGEILIQGQGTIKRANGFDPDTTCFSLGDPHSAAVAGYDINMTIAGDVVFDGNARENGMTNKALFNMTAADGDINPLAPKESTDITFTLKDNAKVVDMYVNYASPGAGIWAAAGDKSSVTINMQDNASFEGMNGIAVRGSDNRGNGALTLNMSGNAKITGSSLSAVYGMTHVNMTDNAQITGTSGDYAVNMFGGTFNMSGSASVDNNTGGGLKSAGNTVAYLSENASIRNNSLAAGSTSSTGAGMYLLGSTKTTLVGSSSVSDNTASGNGGGIYASSSSTIQVRESAHVDGNTASGSGGGIAVVGNKATMTISGTATISGNSASGSGGGIYMPSSASEAVVHINGGQVSGNTAGGNGGGVLVERAGALDLAGGAVTGNTSTGQGAGIYAPQSLYIQGAPQVKDNIAAATKGDVFLERGAVMQLVPNRVLSGLPSSVGILVRDAQAGDHVVEAGSGTVFDDFDAVRFFDDSGTWYVVTDTAQAQPTNLVLGTSAPSVLDIANASVSAIPDQVYTGEPLTPPVKVSYDGRLLVKGTDYTLEYRSNTEVGEATIVISGYGQFVGEKQVHFNIIPPEEVKTWNRLAGSDRYSTAAAIVQEGFEDLSCNTVVIANGQGFADALSASALAGACKGPVILTKGDALSPEAREQVSRLGAKNAYLVGGDGVLSRQVRDDLKDMGLTVTRISGDNRQATSLAVARRVDSLTRIPSVVIACGSNFPDALSIGSYSYASKSPIILTDSKGKLTTDEVVFIKSLGVKDIVIVGGTGAVSASVETQLGSSFKFVRLAGSNRYETSAAIARWVLGETADDATPPAFQPKVVLTCAHPVIATGENFPDALAGAALCGSKGSVMLLVNGKKADLSAGIAELLVQHRGEIEKGYVLGGEGAVPDELMDLLPDD